MTRDAGGPGALRCRCCGADTGPLADLAVPLPDPVAALSDEERARRVVVDDEAAVLDDEHFFVRANVEIPIRGRDRPWVITVWGSLSRENFVTMVERWRDPRRTEMEPCFSWLCNALPCFPTDEPVAARMHVREVGVRPLYEIEPKDHALSRAQREGLELHEAVDLVRRMLAE